MDRELVVFPGRSNPLLSQALSQAMNQELGRLEVVRFSDGELTVEIGENVRGRDVYVVQSTCNPGNDHLMELLIALDALKRSSAWRITAVIPYFGYSRQDRKVKPRVPITAKLIADLLQTAGADRILTMDLHAGQIMGFFDIPVDNLYSLPMVLPYLKQRYGSQDTIIVSPDVGGVARARYFATRFDNAEIAIIYKRRSGPNQIAEMRVVGDVTGKTCILVDDMVDTGGTLAKAAEALLKEGAASVSACCAHPVLSGNALEIIAQSPLQELIVTDSISAPHHAQLDKLTTISVAPLFAEAIRRIHSDDSVSSLFR